MQVCIPILEMYCILYLTYILDNTYLCITYGDSALHSKMGCVFWTGFPIIRNVFKSMSRILHICTRHGDLATSMR